MGSHSKCRGGRGPGWPRLPPGEGSLPRLSGLRSPPKCPTSFALVMPSSLVLAGPRCMTLRRTLHLRGWTALRQHAAAPRLVQCPRALRAARSVVGHLFAPAPRSLFHAAVARPLPCPAISVPLPSGQREHDAEQFARQRSLSAPSLCPGPPALSRPLFARPPSSSLAPLARPLGPWPSVSLSPSSLYPPGIHFAEQYARHPSHSLFTLPPRGALVPGLVARTSHCNRVRHLSLYARPASPSLPCPFPPSFHPLLPLPVHARRRACSPRSLLSLGCATLPLPLQAVTGKRHAPYTAPPVAIYLLRRSLWAPLAPWPSGAPRPPCPPRLSSTLSPSRHYARHCAGNLHAHCRQAPGLYRWRQTTCGVA